MFISAKRLAKMITDINRIEEISRKHKAVAKEVLISEVAEEITERLNKWVDAPYSEKVTPQQDIERFALELAEYFIQRSGKNSAMRDY